MATMAFPPEVTMIPGFLLLKNFPIGYLVVLTLSVMLVVSLRHWLEPRSPKLWQILELVVIALTAVFAARIVWQPLHLLILGAEMDSSLTGNLFLGIVGMLVAFLGILVHVMGGTKRIITARFSLALTGALFLGTVWCAPVVKFVGFTSPNVSLLNTFWALILPGIANGYAIFLLKGFFDSLPQNLYESAQMEGAKELWMFRNITLPLSKPILAVIALQTFNIAYTTFMYAFIVCQDPKMWTLMVWLYDMQFDSPQYIIFAGLVVAAIPTLLVFFLTQRVIMRGIIIPVEK